MHIKDIIDLVHEDIDGKIKKSDLDDVLSSFLRNSKEQLLKGEPVVLKNFGTLSVEIRKPRNRTNPRNGQSVRVPERRVVKFKSGKTFTEELRSE